MTSVHPSVKFISDNNIQNNNYVSISSSRGSQSKPLAAAAVRLLTLSVRRFTQAIAHGYRRTRPQDDFFHAHSKLAKIAAAFGSENVKLKYAVSYRIGKRCISTVASESSDVVRCIGRGRPGPIVAGFGRSSTISYRRDRAGDRS